MSRISSLHNDQVFAKPTSVAWSDYARLTKARIAAMVVITAAVGLALAGAGGASWTWPLWIGTMLGTALSCMGAGTLNQVLERDLDRAMPRTQSRPIPAGRIAPAEGCWIGCGLCLAGVGTLLVTASALAAAISAMTVLSYVFVYTPLKTRSPWAVFVGAVPGAAPPLIGYAAAAHTLSPAAWSVFALMFVWQIPHFLAIGWLYRDDYARAAMPLIAVTDPTGSRTARYVLAGCLLLLPIGLLPTYLGVAGPGYLAVALALGLGFLLLGLGLYLKPTNRRARQVFLASLVYLPMILGALVLGLV